MSELRQYKYNQNEVDESLVAEEIFKPDLTPEFYKRFENLLARLKNNLAISRDVILDEEIKSINIGLDNDIDCLKYTATIYVLRDLSLQGWIFNITDKGLRLRMENDNVDDKSTVRYRLSTERDAQFSVPSIRRFILSMETPREYKGERVSIKNLIGEKTN